MWLSLENDTLMENLMVKKNTKHLKEEIENGVLPIWQPVGYSTHIISKKVSKLLSSGKRDIVKTAHTGTLDPMAEGVIIILVGENRHKKYEYAKWKKTYEFEMILGIKTDTYDGLGIILNKETSDFDPKAFITKEHTLQESLKGESKNEIEIFNKEFLENNLKKFLGTYTQVAPPYSAIKIKGKPLHWYARNKKLGEIELPTREGVIYNIELISQEIISGETIAKNIVKRVKLISGNLRQKEIILRWESFAEMHKNKSLTEEEKAKTYLKIKIKVTTSKGMYVRTLVQDIAKKLGSIAFTYSITRIKNGDYSRENSITLEEIFGKEIVRNKELQSYN